MTTLSLVCVMYFLNFFCMNICLQLSIKLYAKVLLIHQLLCNAIILPIALDFIRYIVSVWFDVDLVINKLNTKQSISDNHEMTFHECLWCTNSEAPTWLSTDTPFTTSKKGNFLIVKDTFELMNHQGVFAAGDCCDMIAHPRPKGE